jgi:hypothetical protein
MAAAGMTAVNVVELMKLVATALPPKFTTEEETKFVPVSWIGDVGSPANLLAGETVIIVGTGLVEARLVDSRG